MPQINKQTRTLPVSNQNRSSSRKGSSITQRIHPVGLHKKGMKVNFYGRGKTGKTRTACTFPKPLLLIGTEDGTNSVSTVKGVEFIKVTASQDLDDLVHEVLSEDKYRTVALDQGGGLQDIILKEVLGLDEVPVQKTFGMASRSDWGTVITRWKQCLRPFFWMADEGLFHFVVIAHERNFGDGNEDSEVMVPAVASALSPQLSNWINGECDYVCQTFIREQEKVTPFRQGSKTLQRKVKTGQMEFCLRIGPHPVYYTGFRVAPEINLPNVIVNPTYEKMLAVIQGNTRSPQKS